MWPFRRPKTPPDVPDRHDMVLDLIEQVASLRGQVRATEIEWDDMRAQIRKGYQRMEKAYERGQPVETAASADDAVAPVGLPAHGFAEKLRLLHDSRRPGA